MGGFFPGSGSQPLPPLTSALLLHSLDKWLGCCLGARWARRRLVVQTSHLRTIWRTDCICHNSPSPEVLERSQTLTLPGTFDKDEPRRRWRKPRGPQCGSSVLQSQPKLSLFLGCKDATAMSPGTVSCCFQFLGSGRDG